MKFVSLTVASREKERAREDEGGHCGQLALTLSSSAATASRTLAFVAADHSAEAYLALVPYIFTGGTRSFSPSKGSSVLKLRLLTAAWLVSQGAGKTIFVAIEDEEAGAKVAAKGAKPLEATQRSTRAPKREDPLAALQKTAPTKAMVVAN